MSYRDERDFASPTHAHHNRSWGRDSAPLTKSSALQVAFRPITKGAAVEGYQRVVTGVVLEPTADMGIADSQGDTYTKAAVEEACYSFAEHGQFQIGLQHREMASPEQAHVLETWIQRGDTTIGGQPVVDGTWLISVRLDPETFQKVLDGSFTGLSIGGAAVRTPLAGGAA